MVVTSSVPSMSLQCLAWFFSKLFCLLLYDCDCAFGRRSHASWYRPVASAEYSNLYASALLRAVLLGAVRPIPDETV
jgi:hypothetical protein